MKRRGFFAEALGIVLTAFVLAGLLAMTACATPEVREVTVTKEVPVPYHQPCPRAEDRPAVPNRVAKDHPVMPTHPDGSTNWEKVSRILGAKVLELFGYVAEAEGVMEECGKPR